MVIQELLFPEIGKCTIEELYFRKENGIVPEEDEEKDELSLQLKAMFLHENSGKSVYDREKKTLRFSKGGLVWFNTYFNGISIEKWKKYTVVNNLSLKLVLQGSFKVVLRREEKGLHDITVTELAEQVITSAEKTEVVLPYPSIEGKGMLSFMLQALEEDSVYYGGAYISEVPENQVRPVTIGVGICTFKREPFIEKNLKLLRSNILENPNSLMYGHLEVFVADNGKTLDIERLQTKNIHMYPNRNLGGAGGFTRDLIEMSKVKDELHITHALLMDDDIVIEPEALIKTYTVLSLLKDQYVDTFVGGAMLRLDQQSIQVESGASWNGGFLNSLKHGLDLRMLDACLYNEIEEYTEFNAWWYCCFPISVVREDNLPLPIFIRGDDLEYGLRNMKNLVLMNGICVWHEPFEAKYSSFLEYYIMRNQLIDNAFHCTWYGKKLLKRALWIHCKQEIMYYRYKNVDLYIQGIEDFLKGPEWLMKQDGEALHKNVMAAGYKFADPKELPMAFSYVVYEQFANIEETRLAHLKRRLTFNGLWVPAKGEAIIPVATPSPTMCFRKKRVMHYDITSNKAFLTERSVKESWRCIFKTLGLSMKINTKLAKAQKAYREQGLKLRTLEFWNEFLGLKN